MLNQRGLKQEAKVLKVVVESVVDIRPVNIFRNGEGVMLSPVVILIRR